ncbi:hypothetical protein KIN20_016214 [Parelaphostrongylus tenuis]|uniref:Uncharacterized protein n=1 Tax=Parelaphostrongylus tenuis TaxID=148309 RepID=A0AAD5QQK3_PARTN|nr:hypothetical protein KIN20_016214 [Parelaphostrongylus tenuis]
MKSQLALVLLFTFSAVITAFECSPDVILRMATNKRLKQLEKECYLEKVKEEPCDTRNDLENAWKDFMNVTNRYKEAVTKCREQTARPSKILDRHGWRRQTIYGKQENNSEKVHPESKQFGRAQITRTRRQVCKTNASKELDQLKEAFLTHCERDNICLPDEDISSEQQRNHFKELHASRAKKYSAYLTQLSLCYGRLS